MARARAAQLLLAWWGLVEGPREAAAQAHEECSRVTGGTCSIFGCEQSRGETECVGRLCLCKEGYCDNRGACQRGRSLKPQCIVDTGGTCFLFGCHSWRGPTDCQGTTCQCKQGFCNELGACHPDKGTFTARVVPVNQEQPVFPGPHGQVKSALIFSGGGARSMTVSFGVLRALHGLGLLENFDLLSSVSGGSWAGAVYMFAKTPIEELLGAPTDPSMLTMANIGLPPAALGAAATVTTSDILSRLHFNEDIAGPLLWSYAVGEAILKNFGLDDSNAHMAASQEDVERIKKANPQLQDSDFVVPAPGRPKAFVMSGALLAPSGYRATEKTVVSLQMSPDFSGSPFYPNNSAVSYEAAKKGDSLDDVVVGGGFVESFAFGGQAPFYGQSGGDAQEMAAPVEPLSLVKAVGVSSAGPASAFTQFANIADVTFLDPITNYWPITSKQQPGPQRAMTYQLGDGGNIDNSGLLVALQRGATRLVWLINTEVPISEEVDFCSMTTAQELAQVSTQLEFQLQANFGFVAANQVGQFLGQNQVFAREDLAPLLCELQHLRKAGKPTMSRRHMTVLANSWWGIKSYAATVVFVYSDRCADFEALLPQDTKDEIKAGPYGRLANYPHYDVVFQNVGETTALLPQQVNLLAAQSEYGILQNRLLFQTLFCESDTGGTCHIFGCGASRNAKCVHGHCVCDTEADMCAVDGACVAGDATALAAEARRRPGQSLAEELRKESLLSVLLAACAACAAISWLLAASAGRPWRRRGVHASQEPLLG